MFGQAGAKVTIFCIGTSGSSEEYLHPFGAMDDDRNVISIKRYLDSTPKESLAALAEAYRSVLNTIGVSSAQVCPPTGNEMSRELAQMRGELAEDLSAGKIAEVEERVEEQLRGWTKLTLQYFKTKASEVKEIMVVMAKAAESLADRDQRYATQFTELRSRLQTIADLDDLTAMRQSIVKSAQELQACVDRMKEDGSTSIVKLRAELATYQERFDTAERLASMDPLTGLGNRRLLESEMDRRVEKGLPFSLMMLDLNGFKEVNDTFGHPAGDQLLKDFANELKGVFRPSDVVGRWGGDEFVVVADCPADKAQTFAQRVRDWVFGDYTVAGAGDHKVAVSASIGIAEWVPQSTKDELIAAADRAMYEQKARQKQTAKS